MTTAELDLFILIAREMARLNALPPRDWPPTKEQINDSIAHQNLVAGYGVRVSGDWIGTDCASRQSRNRALKLLELRGFVKRRAVYGGEKFTHVALTTLGERLAIENGLLPKHEEAKPCPK